MVVLMVLMGKIKLYYILKLIAECRFGFLKKWWEIW